MSEPMDLSDLTQEAWRTTDSALCATQLALSEADQGVIVDNIKAGLERVRDAALEWERAYLLTCPWCGLETKRQPASAQISHLIHCGDRRRDAARAEERKRIIAHLKRRHPKTGICECITLAPDADFEEAAPVSTRLRDLAREWLQGSTLKCGSNSVAAHCKQCVDEVAAFAERVEGEALASREARVRELEETLTAAHKLAQERGESMIALRKRVRELEAEVGRVRGLIDRDKTGLAEGLNAVRQVLRSHWWIANGEWGSYEWHERTEQTFRAEIRACFEEAERVALAALSKSGSRANCAFDAKRPDPDAAPTTEGSAGDGPRCIHCGELRGLTKVCTKLGGHSFSTSEGSAATPEKLRSYERCKSCGHVDGGGCTKEVCIHPGCIDRKSAPEGREP